MNNRERRTLLALKNKDLGCFVSSENYPDTTRVFSVNGENINLQHIDDYICINGMVIDSAILREMVSGTLVRCQNRNPIILSPGSTIVLQVDKHYSLEEELTDEKLNNIKIMGSSYVVFNDGTIHVSKLLPYIKSATSTMTDVVSATESNGLLIIIRSEGPNVAYDLKTDKTIDTPFLNRKDIIHVDSDPLLHQSGTKVMDLVCYVTNTNKLVFPTLRTKFEFPNIGELKEFKIKLPKVVLHGTKATTSYDVFSKTSLTFTGIESIGGVSISPYL